MSRFVLDNTVTMAWCFNDEASPFTETLLSRLSSLTDNAIVPALWLYEVVNVRRKWQSVPHEHQRSARHRRGSQPVIALNRFCNVPLDAGRFRISLCGISQT